MTHDDILVLARTYAGARNKLAERTAEVQEMQRAIVRRRLRGIRSAVAETSTARDALAEAIGANPGLFEKPRTRSIDGVKYGLRKKAGRILVEKTETAIARLRKRLGSAAEGHIRTREELIKDSLRELDARTLSHAGITVVDATDEVTIAMPKDDLDKLVDALLDGMEEEESA